MARFFNGIAWVFAVVMMAGTCACISKNLNENAGTEVEFLAFAEPDFSGTESSHEKHEGHELSLDARANARANEAGTNSAGTQIFKHQIDAIYNGGNDENSYTGIVKWTREELTIIATSELGRLCKIQFFANGKIEQSCAAFLPGKVRENLWRGLRDFQLIFYSAEQINNDGKFFAEETFCGNEDSTRKEATSPDVAFENLPKGKLKKATSGDVASLRVGVPADEKSVPAKIRSIYRVPANQKSVPADAVPELKITILNPEKPLAQQTILVECERWKYRYKLTPIQ